MNKRTPKLTTRYFYNNLASKACKSYIRRHRKVKTIVPHLPDIIVSAFMAQNNGDPVRTIQEIEMLIDPGRLFAVDRNKKSRPILGVGRHSAHLRCRRMVPRSGGAVPQGGAMPGGDAGLDGDAGSVGSSVRDDATVPDNGTALDSGSLKMAESITAEEMAEQTTERKVFLTGASGLLGRSIFKKFQSEGWEVYGVALTRARDGLHQLNLTIEDDVIRAIDSFRPALVIHCAAARYPDWVDGNPDAAIHLNFMVSMYVAHAAVAVGATMLYISTDYVFDGKTPPYNESAPCNPVNLYGRTKRLGEEATLDSSKGNIVLRVPVLYGPVESLSESAVTCLLSPLLQSDKSVVVSDYEQRYPSHVDDIALICFHLAEAKMRNESLGGIYQWCGKERLTKYKMMTEMADVFGLAAEHITPNKSCHGNVPRPHDTRMDVARLTALNMGAHTPFRQGIKDVLTPWIPTSVS